MKNIGWHFKYGRFGRAAAANVPNVGETFPMGNTSRLEQATIT
jgi:hypothetical protein